MEMIDLEFKLNGTVKKIKTFPNRTVLELLREDLNVISVKNGCGEGECGACAVLFDGVPMNSCLILVGQINGHAIDTVESLGQRGSLHPLQEAFVELGAVQCGYCTSGLLLVSQYLLTKNPNPSEEEIRKAISGNICRCTGYQKIVEAIRRASGAVTHEKP